MGEDGGETEARRPVRLRSSGFVDKFSGSSVKKIEYLVKLANVEGTIENRF